MTLSTRRFGRFALALALILAGTSGSALAAGHYSRTPTGILVTPDHGPEKAVRLEVYGDAAICA